MEQHLAIAQIVVLYLSVMQRKFISKNEYRSRQFLDIIGNWVRNTVGKAIYIK